MVERVGVEGHTQDRPLRDDLGIRGVRKVTGAGAR